MNVYILRVIDESMLGYECNRARVVVACSVDCARLIANDNTSGEGRIWQNDSLTSCEVVNLSAEYIVLSDNTGA